MPGLLQVPKQNSAVVPAVPAKPGVSAAVPAAPASRPAVQSARPVVSPSMNRRPNPFLPKR